MPAQYNLEIYQGSDFSVQFQLKDVSEQPLDLSSATVASQIRTISGDLLGAFTISTAVSGTGVRDLVNLTLTRVTTGTFTVGRHKYDILLRIDGLDEPVITGDVVVRSKITVIV
jgi:hypothetical protein